MQKVVTSLKALGSRSGRSLVIASTELDPATGRGLQEDLIVMSRILEKSVSDNLGDSDQKRAMGIHLFSHGGGSLPRTVYLQDYGAIFFLNVGFPLVAPATRKEDPKPERQTNSTWEQAREEIYGSNQGQPGWGKFPKARRTRAAEGYNAEKVERLTTGILTALKNASNIRHLKPDSYISVVVSGAGSGADDVAVFDERMVHGFEGGFHKSDEGSQSMLTIRAKKTDIDAFAKDQISVEEFRKRAARQAYYAGAGSSSGWVFKHPTLHKP